MRDKQRGLIPEAFRGQPPLLQLGALRCSSGLHSVKVDSDDPNLIQRASHHVVRWFKG